MAPKITIKKTKKETNQNDADILQEQIIHLTEAVKHCVIFLSSIVSNIDDNLTKAQLHLNKITRKEG